MNSTRTAAWTRDELEETLQKASPFVRHLLWEVAQQPAVPVEELKSPNAAAALVKRLALKAGREPLIVRSEHTGRPTYSLNPNYRGWIREVVKDDAEMPEARPRKKPVARRQTAAPRAREMEASGEAPRRGRPRKLAATGRVDPVRREGPSAALEMPDDVSLDFCRALARFLNEAPRDSRFRVVLEGDRCLLEYA